MKGAYKCAENRHQPIPTFHMGQLMEKRCYSCGIDQSNATSGLRHSREFPAFHNSQAILCEGAPTIESDAFHRQAVLGQIILYSAPGQSPQHGLSFPANS